MKKNKRGEAGWIAEEIFSDPALKLHSTCASIERTIENGILSLEDALEIYEVSSEDYSNYLKNK